MAERPAGADPAGVRPAGEPVAGEVPAGERSEPGLRQVLLAAGLAVVAVLGAAVLTSLLPSGLQGLVFHQPLAIVVLIAGTAFVLWSVATRRPPGA